MADYCYHDVHVTGNEKLMAEIGRRDAALAMSDPSQNRFGWGITPNRSGDGHGLITITIQNFGGRFVDGGKLRLVAEPCPGRRPAVLRAEPRAARPATDLRRTSI